MKQIVRKNTFETNSSSMHSLVIVKNPKPYSDAYDKFNYYYRDKRHSYHLFNREEGVYGRFPFRVLRSPEDKMRYYVAHYIGAFNKKELIPKVKTFIAKQLGISQSKVNIKAYDEYDDKYEGYGYAGLNDTGEDVFSYIEDNNISMEEFVLNPKYVVIVDGDEYQEFKKLFESNILDANDFEYVSSGPAFWNDEDVPMSIAYMDSNNMLGVDESNITAFKKTVTFKVYDEEYVEYYDKWFPKVSEFMKKIKEKRPDIKCCVQCATAVVPQVLSRDLSVFDILKQSKDGYDYDVTEIALKTVE